MTQAMSRLAIGGEDGADRVSKLRSVLRALCLTACCLAVVGCPEDPPDTGFLVVSVRPTIFEDLESLSLTNESVEVILDAEDEANDGKIVLVEETRTLDLELNGHVRALQTILEVPAGSVEQIRFIQSAITAKFSTSPESVSVFAPSGAQTGLKVIPADGEPFPIEVGKITRIEVLFDPEKQIVINPKKVILKPTIRAELVGIEDPGESTRIPGEAIVRGVVPRNVDFRVAVES